MNNNIRKNIRLDNFMIVFTVIIYIFMIFVMPFILVFGLDREYKLKMDELSKPYIQCETLIKNHLYIVTERFGYKNYYKIKNLADDKLYETNEFDYEENEMLHLNNCFESYRDNKTNEILNRLDKKNCKVRDKNWKIVDYNKKILSIINLTKKLKYNIVRSDVVIMNNDYYVIIGLDINDHTDYCLYKYENNKLNIVNIFENEDIIALKQIK